ncbi:diguanylate cyclase domain-containing protein [Pseudorhodoplanes sp.]|uniref:bifunctional diguanylate cyclase/phosphodiesterase n=1 Tax=Pseudorhodoplanes sp. TaxID=1934341 RepID=UPI00391B6772
MIALLWSNIFVFLRYDRQAAIDAAMTNTANLARAFGEHTSRTIFGEDSTLVVLRTLLSRDSESFSAVDWTRLPDAVLQYSVIDRTGKLAASSLGETAAIDLSDRNHFAHHLNTAEDALYIGRAQTDRASQRASIQLSRKLIAPDGAFAGVIVASLDQQKLTSFYETIDVGKDGAISLIGLDGHVRASRGFKRDITYVPPDSPLQQRAQTKQEGSYITSGSFDGVPRILSYRKIENLPLIVTSAVSKSEVLTPHYRKAFEAKTIGAGITAIIVVVMGFSISNRLRLDRALDSLQNSEKIARERSEQFSITLDNIDQGIIMVDPDGCIRVINRRAVALLDIPEDWLRQSLTFRELGARLWDRGEFEGSRHPHIHNAIAGNGIFAGPAVYDRTRPNGTILEIRHVPLPNGGLVRTITDITARRKAEERIRHLALHDELTGLPNRAAFRDRIEQCFKEAQRHGECFALLTFDLDRFKTINDTLGHLAGDAVLREVAQRLTPCIRDVDLAARLGGDEFAIVQPAIRSSEDAAALGQRILDAMRTPFRIGDRTTGIGISIGVALAPRHASNFKDLIAVADAALYRAKRNGGNRYAFCEAGSLRPVA